MLEKLKLAEILSNDLIKISLIALLVIFIGFVVKRIVLKKLLALLAKITSLSKTESDDYIIENISFPVGNLIMLTAVYFAASLYKPYVENELVFKVIDNGFLVFMVYMAMALVFVFIEGFSIFVTEWTAKTSSTADDQFGMVIKKSLKVLSVVVAVLFLIQNLGYSVSGLVASLGLGGLTVALAAKDAVSNFFGSLIIIFDSPFKIGDWIKTSSVEGVVEEIGFRSTKVRTFEKSLVTVPNFSIANTNVENFTNRDRRRIKFTLGLEYSTPVDKVERIVAGIKQLIEENDGIRTDFYLVNFKTLGDSALEIFVYCFTNTTVWKDYLNIGEQFNLDILRLAEAEGVNIAFPSQSIYLEKMPEFEK